jgi:hypothetical protein
MRKNWNDFDKETRKYIKKRDNNQCVICGATGALQIMHIFVNKAHGGKGSKENGCCGCIRCHVIIDNPIGEEQNKLSKITIEKAKNYLIEKENLTINKKFIDSLKYKKTYREIKPIEIPRFENKCRNCKFFKKNKYGNTTLNTYYCVANKKVVGKNNVICKKFKERR